MQVQELASSRSFLPHRNVFSQSANGSLRLSVRPIRSRGSKSQDGKSARLHSGRISKQRKDLSVKALITDDRAVNSIDTSGQFLDLSV